MKRIVICLFVLIANSKTYAQQDALYSQYMQNPVLINPAYSGTYNMMSATFMTRVQWVGLEGAPTTNSLSAHTAFANNRLGGGVILVNDRFGINNNTEAHGTLAYKLRLSDNDDHVLSFGMQASMVNYNYNYSNVKLKDGGDESFISGNKVATEPNFGAGVFYRSEKFFGGLSAPKILNSQFADGNLSVGQYRRHFFATAGYLVDMTSVQFKPSVLIRYVDGAPVSADINASFLLKDKIWLGASLRKLNTAVLMAQFQLNDMFRLGYSVDLPMNSVIKASYGSHEIMLNMDLKLLQSHDIGLRYF